MSIVFTSNFGCDAFRNTIHERSSNLGAWADHWHVYLSGDEMPCIRASRCSSRCQKRWVQSREAGLNGGRTRDVIWP
jgi:hypothetical protein